MLITLLESIYLSNKSKTITNRRYKVHSFTLQIVISFAYHVIYSIWVSISPGDKPKLLFFCYHNMKQKNPLKIKDFGHLIQRYLKQTNFMLLLCWLINHSWYSRINLLMQWWKFSHSKNFLYQIKIRLNFGFHCNSMLDGSHFLSTKSKLELILNCNVHSKMSKFLMLSQLPIILYQYSLTNIHNLQAHSDNNLGYPVSHWI